MVGARSKPDAELRHLASRRLAAFDRRAIPLDGRQAAAVAIALLEEDDGSVSFVLTRRARGLRRHSGQWALPGGRVDPGEAPAATALRELREEVGVACEAEAVLGLLDDYATRSGFVITPVVLWAGRVARLVPNPGEVAAVHRVPVDELRRPDLAELRWIRESPRPVLSIPLLGRRIHAPTAAVLYQLREVVLFGRATRVAHFEQPRFAWR